eukprot:gene6570-biopygen10434
MSSSIVARSCNERRIRGRLSGCTTPARASASPTACTGDAPATRTPPATRWARHDAAILMPSMVTRCSHRARIVGGRSTPVKTSKSMANSCHVIPEVACLSVAAGQRRLAAQWWKAAHVVAPYGKDISESRGVRERVTIRPRKAGFSCSSAVTCGSGGDQAQGYRSSRLASGAAAAGAAAAGAAGAAEPASIGSSDRDIEHHAVHVEGQLGAGGGGADFGDGDGVARGAGGGKHVGRVIPGVVKRRDLAGGDLAGFRVSLDPDHLVVALTARAQQLVQPLPAVGIADSPARCSPAVSVLVDPITDVLGVGADLQRALVLLQRVDDGLQLRCVVPLVRARQGHTRVIRVIGAPVGAAAGAAETGVLVVRGVGGGRRRSQTVRVAAGRGGGLRDLGFVDGGLSFADGGLGFVILVGVGGEGILFLEVAVLLGVWAGTAGAGGVRGAGVSGDAGVRMTVALGGASAAVSASPVP